MNKRPTLSAVIVVFNKKKQILLVKHKAKAEHLNDIYGLPAGRKEVNEELIDTAKRELSEETNLITESNYLKQLPKKYINTAKRKSGNFEKFESTVFLCTKYKGKLSENEETAPEWVNIEELEKLYILDISKLIIKDALVFMQKI